MSAANFLKGKTLDQYLADLEEQPRDWTCEEHGLEYGEGKPDPCRMRWDCPECERIAYAAERDFHALHSRHDWWLRNAGIPHRYRAAVPEHLLPHNPSAKTLRAFVDSYVRSPRARVEDGQGGLLLGPPGLGKTLALAAIANAYCRVLRGPVYAVWSDALADVKAGFGAGREDPRRQAIERLRDVPLLLLDELGVKGMSDFDHSELFALIDYRYRHQRPTVAAANSTRAAFPDLVGERVADRLFEVGPTVVVTGDSQRGKTTIDGPDAFPLPPPTLTVRVHGHGKFRDRVIEARAHYRGGYQPVPGEV